jgi:aminomethyltransferase
MKAGEPFEIEPIGLGARDSLRLEMKFALYGNDIDDTTNPIEAGLSWVVDLNKNDFIGKNALIEAKENIRRRLVSLEMRERSFPRHGYEVMANGNVIGLVTSGTFSPSTEKGIAMAYVEKDFAKPGTEVGVMIRDRIVMCDVVKPPFYKSGSVKTNG